jgi:uncharacterized membrane protein
MDSLRERRLASLDVKRIQSLTDAVFAIVITILSLSLVVPANENDEGLRRFLWDQILPKLFIFFLGFIIVGAYWVDTHYNHHHILKVDKMSIWLNIFFLMFICLIPFSSGFLANYLYSSISVIIYSINLIIVSSWHLAMLIYSWKRKFIHPHIDKKLYRNMILRIVLPIAIYLMIIPVSLLRTPWVVYLFLLPLFFQIFFGRSKKEVG